MSIYGPLRTIIKNLQPERFLEIGVQYGDNFNRVKCSYKVGIDPNSEICKGLKNKIYKGTSNKVFASNDFKENESTFDLIFIDGFHEFKQVIEDVQNSLEYLSCSGIIVCHDVFPFQFIDKIENLTSKKYPGPQDWTGDVWKMILYVKYYMLNFRFCTISEFPGYLCIWDTKKTRIETETMSINEIDNLTDAQGRELIPLMNIGTVEDIFV